MMDEHDVMILELRQAAYDYAEIVRELRQDASTSRDLYLADAIEALSVECKEWKDRGDALEKALNVAFADFAEFEKSHSWISVDRQLPERGEWVLAYRELFGSIWPAYLIGDNLWMNEAGEAHHVTHWMPMPEPPKEEL